MSGQRGPSTPAVPTPDMTVAPGIHVPHPSMDLRITAAPVANHLFTTVSIDVSVDGTTVLRTGGQPRPTGSSSAEFLHRGQPHTLTLSWDRFTPQGFPCVLCLDGVELARRTVPLTRRALLRWTPVLLMAVPVVIGVLLRVLLE